MAEDADIDDVQPALFRRVERDDFSDLKERIAAFARPVFNKLEAVECSASLVTLFQSKSIDSKDRRGCKTSAGTIEGWLVKNGVGSDGSDGSQQQLVAFVAIKDISEDDIRRTHLPILIHRPLQLFMPS